IGTSVDGASPLGNVGDGVQIRDGAKTNTVGGTAAGAGNVISDNEQSGVAIFGAGATGNAVIGNFIGTNAAGTARLGNFRQDSGVYVNIGPSTIGGTAAGSRNIITGNGT